MDGMDGSFSFIRVQLQRELLWSLQLVTCHSHDRPCYLPYCYFLPCPFHCWKVPVFEVYFWSSFSPLIRQAPRGQGQWLLCFLKFLQNPISAWYLIRMNSCCPWGLQIQLPEGFTYTEDHATGSICPPFCAEWERQMGKERSAQGTWHILASKHPRMSCECSEGCQRDHVWS